ncbi:hypothetical protein C5167_009991 [Papaver somniferum]|uniref:F-box associated beta-propeller type 3 domain-containing protein n=1 Tax=Papaver somniferum TaxID=3469 RepID=A0A4Y7JYZ2_PAPSO|nr:hypothetical protein C5167_009991 [Papaver somniferum]
MEVMISRGQKKKKEVENWYRLMVVVVTSNRIFEEIELHQNVVYDRNDNRDVNVRLTLPYARKGNFFGYCNGLSCFTKVYKKTAFVIDVWNFTTNELLRIIPPVIVDKEDTSPTRGFGYTLLSRGFGFDSLNNEYKLVLIVYMLKTERHQGFVYTSGTKSSWKAINLPEQKLNSIQGTFTAYGGGGALFWKTSDRRTILLFDLHQDKFQYIQIPLERGEYPTSKDHIYLFEIEGFLGVAILIGSSSTTTLEKAHLKIYKDNQVWVVRELASSICENRLPQRATREDYWLNCDVQNISSLRTLLPERAQKSDFESIGRPTILFTAIPHFRSSGVRHTLQSGGSLLSIPRSLAVDERYNGKACKKNYHLKCLDPTLKGLPPGD